MKKTVEANPSGTYLDGHSQGSPKDPATRPFVVSFQYLEHPEEGESEKEKLKAMVVGSVGSEGKNHPEMGDGKEGDPPSHSNLQDSPGSGGEDQYRTDPEKRAHQMAR